MFDLEKTLLTRLQAMLRVKTVFAATAAYSAHRSLHTARRYELMQHGVRSVSTSHSWLLSSTYRTFQQMEFFLK